MSPAKKIRIDDLHEPVLTDIQKAALAFGTMFFAVSMFIVYLPTWAELKLGMTAATAGLRHEPGTPASPSAPPPARAVSSLPPGSVLSSLSSLMM